MIVPGAHFDKESVAMTQNSQDGANKKILAADNVQEAGPLQFLVDIVPTNIFESASDNRNMLQIIFFAILFGLSMVVLPNEKTLYVKGFFDGLNDIILKIVDFIMLVSPYGVFALLGAVVVDFGASSTLFIALGKYSLTAAIGLLLMIILIYPMILLLFTKVKYLDFKAISPAQMLAFSTSSSAATLPVTMERCEEHFGISEEVSSFVLPLGATINMDGTSLSSCSGSFYCSSIWYRFRSFTAAYNCFDSYISIYWCCCCTWCRYGNVSNSIRCN